MKGQTLDAKQLFSKRTAAILVAVVALCVPFARAAEWDVSSVKAFERAVDSAEPGDEIIIADGAYSNWKVSVGCRGTEKRPIVVRAENEHKAVFSGVSSFRIGGQHVVVRGLAFEDCELELSPISFGNARYCRVTDCRFTDLGGRVSVVRFEGRAEHNRVDHCEFKDIVGRSVQVKINEDSVKDGPPLSNRIDHNLFQDVPPKGSNGRETIQIGQDQKLYGHIESRTLVENNVFLRCDGEIEIISNKGAANTFRGNLFKDCKGELTLRGGERCLVEGNRFEGCNSGIRVLGTKHRVIENVIIGAKDAGIRLGFGHTREQGGLNQAAGGCLVANNTIVGAGEIGIWLGAVPSQGGISERPFAPHDNRIVNNIITGTSGTLLKIDRSPANVVEHNLLFAKGEAEVGDSGAEAVLADPLFKDETASDFRLKPASPAVGAGIAFGPDGSANIGATGKAAEAWESELP